MSIAEIYTCDQCGRTTRNLLGWIVLDGNLQRNPGDLSLKPRQVFHWCTRKCFLNWFDSDEQFKGVK